MGDGTLSAQPIADHIRASGPIPHHCLSYTGTHDRVTALASASRDGDFAIHTYSVDYEELRTVYQDVFGTPCGNRKSASPHIYNPARLALHDLGHCVQRAVLIIGPSYVVQGIAGHFLDEERMLMPGELIVIEVNTTLRYEVKKGTVAE